jgi:aspartyl protease family protein
VSPAFDTQSPYFIPMIAGGLILLIVLLRLPFIGALIRTLFSVALIGVMVLLLVQRAPFDPYLARIADRFQLDRQEVVGSELRIPMSSNGHFFANVTINGVKRRMLIDSGATVTALSERTAAEAGLKAEAGLLPVVVQTANGTSQAQATAIGEMKLGNIVARDLKAIVSPGLQDMDLLGMNFLSKLKSWRVEDGTLVLVPHHPQPVG